jgi:putative DNA-binding protein
MVKFKVIERLMKIGPLKGKKGYGAAPKAQEKFSQSWLIQRIVRETSLSEGDVRNVLITLRNIIIEVVTLGGALDLGDIFSLRVSMPSTFIEKEEDVTSKVLKKPGIIVTWKDNIRQALKNIEVEVDNPKRKDLNKKPKTPKP